MCAWVNMELEPHPVSEVTNPLRVLSGTRAAGPFCRDPYIRGPDSPEKGEEGARGFEDRRFSPEP